MSDKPYRGRISNATFIKTVGDEGYYSGTCEEYVNPANNWNGIIPGRPMHTSMVVSEYYAVGKHFVETLNSVYEIEEHDPS